MVAVKVRHVRQEQPAGCLAACCAMIAGISYREAARQFGADFDKAGGDLKSARRFALDHGFGVVEVVAHGSRDVRASNRRMLRPFADLHVLRVEPKIDSAVGHAVVMDARGRVFDPLADGRVDPAGYYFVTHVLGLFDERPPKGRRRGARR